MVSELDDKMLSLNEAIQACLEVENGTSSQAEPAEKKPEEEKRQEDIVEHILGRES